jgi:hypothetical protein
VCLLRAVVLVVAVVVVVAVVYVVVFSNELQTVGSNKHNYLEHTSVAVETY